jgi:hypothetical protein
MPRRRLRLEPLEDRRTPATLVDGTTVTFTDADGDAATVAFSKSVLTAANVGAVFQFDTPFDAPGPQQLQTLNLSGLPAGLSVRVSGVAAGGGDGKVSLDWFRGSGKDFGTVSISGDVGRITAGSFNTPRPAVEVLEVGSVGPRPTPGSRRFAGPAGSPWPAT